jgi:hypothetical protein
MAGAMAFVGHFTVMDELDQIKMQEFSNTMIT